MTKEEVIKQLQDIKCHCQEMYDAEVKNGDTSYSIWGKDVEALTMAIKVLEQQPCEYNPFTIDELDDEDIKKKLREYQNQKVLVTEHDCSPSVTIIEPSEDCISREEVNLCNSCTARRCIFQSGIFRSHCEIYKAKSEDKE